MSRSNKYLFLMLAFNSALATTACATPTPTPTPLNQTHNNPNNSSPAVDLSDLNNRSENYAVQQLRTRGFNQVGAKPASSTGVSQSWWMYLNTNQCFQLDIARHKVMSIEPKSSQDCHNTR
jgi:hypothetical protein